jgi:hypothetical protein
MTIFGLSLSFATLCFAVKISSEEAVVQATCIQKKKRSRPKRRNIYCIIHDCHLDSVSQKHHLFAAQPEQLQSRGMSRITSQLVINAHTTVSIQGEWLEAFWCDQCQDTRWYHVCKLADRAYKISLAPDELWLSVGSVIHPNGNPSVGEFTRREAKMTGYQGLKAFNTIR